MDGAHDMQPGKRCQRLNVINAPTAEKDVKSAPQGPIAARGG
ncbi:Fur family transcriptional regulator [Martelella alba]|uniref:Fur family transcriptional regulator n=1 Tax=Martelella alba TaxID=2590451 RepID=A0ABY2SEP7_9HYPH|nr:Fur family transcriptional regulator [Martelella alba]